MMLRVCHRAIFFSLPKLPSGLEYQSKMQELSQNYNKQFNKEEQERLRNLKASFSTDKSEKFDLILTQLLNLNTLEMRILKQSIMKARGNPEYDWPIFERENKKIDYKLADGPLGELGIAEKPAEFLEQLMFAKAATKVETEEKVEEKVVEKDIFNLVLKGFDPSTKVKLIKTVKDLLGLGLKESKDTVEGVAVGPVLLFKNVSKDSHKAIAEQLQANGGIIEFQ